MDARKLCSELGRLDGDGYGALKRLKGVYAYDWFSLAIQKIQSDPFAPPSRITVSVSYQQLGYPEWVFRSSQRTLAFRDYLVRNIASQIGLHHKSPLGIDTPGQEILDQDAVVLTQKGIEIRMRVQMPAFGRKIAGKQARWIFEDHLPTVLMQSVLRDHVDEETLREHVETYEDAESVRSELSKRDLVAFIADGSILPRKSGIDQSPMATSEAIPFQSPESLSVTLQCPNRGSVTGMGIPRGVTLLVGGGYHGKSTLLNAIERGVYAHRPGDGRELVLTDPDAVKVRSEDGRSIVNVGITPFISHLPGGKSTDAFSSENASGSTSQAANIMEMLEVGASTLLIDEDTSATNFMIRDERMQQLIQKDKEPITPFLDKVRQLYEELAVSSILVMGGSGDYLEVADTVIALEDHRVFDKTEETKNLLREYPVSRRRGEGGEQFGEIKSRYLQPRSIDTKKGTKDKLQAKGMHTIICGREDISLGAVEQLVDTSQVNAIASILSRLSQGTQSGRLSDLVAEFEAIQDREGVDALGGNGDVAYVRRLELAAAINRLRSISLE